MCSQRLWLTRAESSTDSHMHNFKLETYLYVGGEGDCEPSFNIFM